MSSPVLDDPPDGTGSSRPRSDTPHNHVSGLRLTIDKSEHWMLSPPQIQHGRAYLMLTGSPIEFVIEMHLHNSNESISDNILEGRRESEFESPSATIISIHPFIYSKECESS